MRKKYLSDREKLLKIEAESQKFAKLEELAYDFGTKKNIRAQFFSKFSRFL